MAVHDLASLVDAITDQLAVSKDIHISKRTALKDIIESFDTTTGELDRYIFVDPKKKYTRNLIATDNSTFSLMLLVWNPGRESPIHDHPCMGCWMRVITGEIVEHRYQKNVSADTLELTRVSSAKEGAVLYIDDSEGLHKIGNPSPDALAITMHLYSPPYTRCCIWLDTEHASDALHPVTTFHSEFGERVEYEQGTLLCSDLPAAVSATATRPDDGNDVGRIIGGTVQ